MSLPPNPHLTFKRWLWAGVIIAVCLGVGFWI
jgi:hypothetical protein